MEPALSIAIKLEAAGKQDRLGTARTLYDDLGRTISAAAEGKEN